MLMRVFFILLTFMLGLAAAGCMPRPSIEGQQTYAALSPVPAAQNHTPYRVGPHDTLRINYFIHGDTGGDYLLQPGDSLRVEFTYNEELSREVVIRPDGRITLPHIGSLPAAAIKPDELAGRIREAFKKVLLRPEVTVDVLTYGGQLEALRNAVYTAQFGQNYHAAISSSGRLALPLLPAFPAAGLSVEAIETIVNDAYSRKIAGVAVSVALDQPKSSQIYVVGAVTKPGYYPLAQPTTALQAVALSGGYTEDAELSNVVIITRDASNHAMAEVVNMKDILARGDLSQDRLLKRHDIVFVPASLLSEASLIGERLRKMVPVNFSASYALNNDYDSRR